MGFGAVPFAVAQRQSFQFRLFQRSDLLLLSLWLVKKAISAVKEPRWMTATSL